LIGWSAGAWAFKTRDGPLHPEFTLHDDTHLLRVTELMAQVMPARVLEKVLNPVEIALLILAAHFHDVGMIVDAQEASQIRQSEGYMIARQIGLLKTRGLMMPSKS